MPLSYYQSYFKSITVQMNLLKGTKRNNRVKIDNVICLLIGIKPSTQLQKGKEKTILFLCNATSTNNTKYVKHTFLFPRKKIIPKVENAINGIEKLGLLLLFLLRRWKTSSNSNRGSTRRRSFGVHKPPKIPRSN